MNTNDARPGGCEANRRSAMRMQRAGRRPGVRAIALDQHRSLVRETPSANGTARWPPAGSGETRVRGQPACERGDIHFDRCRCARPAAHAAGGSHAAQTSGVHAGKLVREVSSSEASARSMAGTLLVRHVSASLIERLVGFGVDGGFDAVLAGLERAGRARRTSSRAWVMASSWAAWSLSSFRWWSRSNLAGMRANWASSFGWPSAMRARHSSSESRKVSLRLRPSSTLLAVDFRAQSGDAAADWCSAATSSVRAAASVPAARRMAGKRRNQRHQPHD